jgi:hypothetical protein
VRAVLLSLVASVALAGTANAECRCMAVAADVAASVKADAMMADNLYAKGDFNGALALYAKAYGTSKDAALLYAQGMCEWQLNLADKAKAHFQAYLSAGGTLAYRDRVEANLKDIGAGVGAAVGGTAAVATTVGHGALGLGEHVGGTVGGAVDTGVGVTGTVAGGVAAEAKPPKVGHTAGIVLGVIAIAAIGAVGIHSIAAGVSDDISLDAKFDLGLGVTGVAVGISAIYVAGLTAATASVPKCAVAPVPMHGGGGLAAALSF